MRWICLARARPSAESICCTTPRLLPQLPGLRLAKASWSPGQRGSLLCTMYRMQLRPGLAAARPSQPSVVLCYHNKISMHAAPSKLVHHVQKPLAMPFGCDRPARIWTGSSSTLTQPHMLLSAGADSWAPAATGQLEGRTVTVWWPPPPKMQASPSTKPASGSTGRFRCLSRDILNIANYHAIKCFSDIACTRLGLCSAAFEAELDGLFLAW